MPNETCPHCTKKKKELFTMALNVAGNTLNLRICSGCKEALEKVSAFASAFPAGTSRIQTPKEYKKPAKAKASSILAKPTKEQKAKFEKYALSREEIAKTQAMRPTIRFEDTPRKRMLDDIDKVAQGKRVSIYCMGSGKLAAGRNKKITREAQAKLGTENIKCLKDDGFEAIFEAA